MAHPLRIGLWFAGHTHGADVQRTVWRIADEAGFDHLWGFDHLHVPNNPAAPVFDGWTALAVAAEVTKRVRLGLLVTGNLYRHPALLARIATTVEHFSGGRLEMGIGAGWNEPEFTMYGMPYPSAERVRRLDETCSVLRKLWTEEHASFQGKHYRLEDAVFEPKPIQKPHPPLWIGGAGPRIMRVVGTHADVWASMARGPEAVAAAWAIVEKRCAEIGRDPATIRKSRVLWGDTHDAVMQLAEGAVKSGWTELLIAPRGPDALAMVGAAAEQLLPRLRQLG